MPAAIAVPILLNRLELAGTRHGYYDAAMGKVFSVLSTSIILGTAAYLSPEQVGSGDSSPRSDVYSVGILAYELLTGTTPFTGDNPLTVAYQRMDNDVPAPSR